MEKGWKRTIEIGDIPIETSIHRGFSIAMFDYQMVIDCYKHGCIISIVNNANNNLWSTFHNSINSLWILSCSWSKIYMIKQWDIHHRIQTECVTKQRVNKRLLKAWCTGLNLLTLGGYGQTKGECLVFLTQIISFVTVFQHLPCV